MLKIAFPHDIAQFPSRGSRPYWITVIYKRIQTNYTFPRMRRNMFVSFRLWLHSSLATACLPLTALCLTSPQCLLLTDARITDLLVTWSQLSIEQDIEE